MKQQAKFNKDKHLRIIIEEHIQQQYESDPEQFIKMYKNKTLDDIINEHYKLLNEIDEYINFIDPEFHEELNNNLALFSDYYTTLLEGIYIPTSFVLSGAILYFLIKHKIVGHALSKIQSALHRIGKFLQDKTESYKIASLFVKNIPRDCIKTLNKLQEKIPYNASIEQIRDIVSNELIASVSGYRKFSRQKFSKDEREFVNCVINYLIQTAGVSLSLFYKCLFDNKKFMDLIQIKRLNPETILNVDASSLNALIKTVSSNCMIYYNDFKEQVKTVQLLIDKMVIYPEDRKELHTKLIKAINEASKYAQKLLDEGKKKQQKR